MLKKSNTVAPAASANPRTGEAEEISIVSSSALVFDCRGLPEQKLAQHYTLCREAERSPEIVYLTRKRPRATRLTERFEDSLYLLILAAVLGYLLIAFLCT